MRRSQVVRTLRALIATTALVVSSMVAVTPAAGQDIELPPPPPIPAPEPPSELDGPLSVLSPVTWSACHVVSSGQFVFALATLLLGPSIAVPPELPINPTELAKDLEAYLWLVGPVCLIMPIPPPIPTCTLDDTTMSIPYAGQRPFGVVVTVVEAIEAQVRQSGTVSGPLAERFGCADAAEGGSGGAPPEGTATPSPDEAGGDSSLADGAIGTTRDPLAFELAPLPGGKPTAAAGARDSAPPGVATVAPSTVVSAIDSGTSVPWTKWLILALISLAAGALAGRVRGRAYAGHLRGARAA